ncbi:hypothetical protein GCM10023155_30840 [Bremerella cremea]
MFKKSIYLEYLVRMSALNQILSKRPKLSMSVDSWEMYRTTPNWMRERMLAVNHFQDDVVGFEIAEVLLSEAIDDGDAADQHLLSLLVNSAATSPLELDMGFGRYLRPNEPGNMILTSAGVSTEIKGKGPFHSITFYIDKDALNSRASRLLGEEFKSLDVLHSNFFRDDALEVLMKRLLHQYQASPAAGQRMTAGDVVDDIVRRLLVISKHKLPNVRKRDRLRPDSIQRALDFMHAHFADDLSRDQIAGVAGVDPCHFTRLFRQTMGETPKRYLLKIRIDHAKQLLRYGSMDLSMTEIAQQCGFYSPSHLGREFRRQVGTTPNLYRTYS